MTQAFWPQEIQSTSAIRVRDFASLHALIASIVMGETSVEKPWRFERSHANPWIVLTRRQYSTVSDRWTIYVRDVAVADILAVGAERRQVKLFSFKKKQTLLPDDSLIMMGKKGLTKGGWLGMVRKERLLRTSRHRQWRVFSNLTGFFGDTCPSNETQFPISSV